MRTAVLAGILVLGSAGSVLAQGDSGLTVDFGAPPPVLPPPSAAPARPAVSPPAPAAAGPAAPGVVAPSLPPPPPPPPPSVLYTAADLAAQPTAQQIIDAYPSAARLMSVRARVTMECNVAADGRLTDCRVTDVASRGTGFEQAALRLAPLYRMRATRGEGGASLLINFSPEALKEAGGRF